MDVNRNLKGQTAVAPYAVRPKPGAPIAAPVKWDDLRNLEPQSYTLSNAHDLTDAWKGMDNHAVSLKKITEKIK